MTYDDRPGQGVLSVHTLRDVRYHLQHMSDHQVTCMAVAWGTFMAIVTTEVNREIANRIQGTDENSLMQASAPGEGRDGNDNGDKFPGRPKRKYKRDSRRRSLTDRRRTIEQELMELSMNIRGSRSNVNRVCDETARRLRRILGRRLDDVLIDLGVRTGCKWECALDHLPLSLPNPSSWVAPELLGNGGEWQLQGW